MLVRQVELIWQTVPPNGRSRHRDKGIGGIGKAALCQPHSDVAPVRHQALLQLVEQRPGVHKVRSIEAFGEPAIDRGE
jgi:hypothetical protein